MKYIYLTIFFASILFLVSCAELQQELPQVPDTNFHGEGVFNPQSPNYHGKLVAESTNGMDDCKQCHGADFSGGTTSVGCSAASCHPTITVHKDGIIEPTSQNFHGLFIKGIKWDLMNCADCHQTDFAGGLASPTCLTCHVQPEGPEACNTCHGDFNDANLFFPPEDLNENTETTVPGVGAHVEHLVNNDLGSDIECSTCHTVPATLYDTGHIDSDQPAEVIFNKLAVFNAGGSSSYDYPTATCSDTYCHGNFIFYRDSSAYPTFYEDPVMVGNNFTPVWNQVDGTQAQCGSCHGLPPTGHQPAALSSCATCHQGVVNANGEIIDSSKHINGIKNVFGN